MLPVSRIAPALRTAIHDIDSPRKIHHLGIRIVDNLTTVLCFIFVVYFIQQYIEQREALAREVQQQRDRLQQDLELAAQVQRLFLPAGKPVIAGLQIAGMMRPVRSVGGDYYDYIPPGAHTIEVVVADVSGEGVPAAFLMSVTAAAMRLEANRDRNMLELLGRLTLRQLWPQFSTSVSGEHWLRNAYETPTAL
jgi:Stage II sporulation protein E (SpoIIE)